MRDIIARGAAIEIPFDGAAIAEVVRANWGTEAARSRTRAIAHAAQQLVRTRYGGERMAAQYAAVYRRVTERQAVGHTRTSG